MSGARRVDVGESLRICLFDPGSQKGEAFQEPFECIQNATIIAHCSNWPDLREWIKHTGIDLVIANLDDPDDTVLQTVQNVVRLSPACKIIGVSANTDHTHIIKAMRAGCTQFVCWPVDREDLLSAVEQIRSTKLVTTSASKRICVIGSSGGAGATTIACNLALEFGSLSDRRAALIDLNLEFGDVGCAFDCVPKFSVADVCKSGVEPDRLLLSKAMHELPCNISILPRPENISQAREVTPEGVEALLRTLADLYPFVVVDLPRAYSFLSAAALRAADRVLLVTQLGVPFIRNATRIFQCLLEMDTEEDRIGIVLNRCKANYERISPEEVEAHFGRPVFAMVPNDYRRVQSALDFGQPIVTDSPSSAVRAAIQEMARKIATENSPETLGSRSPEGLFGKFWKRKTKIGT
jgi:pilus assembly protein CpaE